MEKGYTIKNDNILFPVFFSGTILFLFCLGYALFATKFEMSEIISLSVFTIFFAVLALDSKFWRVTVEGNVIKYRSSYGFTKTYDFNDITKGVYTKRGSLKIYIGEKKIFTFYDNLEFSSFEAQMSQKNIPIKGKSNTCIIKPQNSYLMITIFIFIGFVLFTILCCTVKEKNLLLCAFGLFFSIISVLTLIDLCLDKTVVEGNVIRRKRFLKKKCSISFSDISEVKTHKGLFRDNLVIYKNGKKVIFIWTKNEGIDWLRAKMRKEKIQFKR